MRLEQTEQIAHELVNETGIIYIISKKYSEKHITDKREQTKRNYELLAKYIVGKL